MLGKVGEILLDERVKGLSCFFFAHIAVKLHDRHDEEHVTWASHHAAVELEYTDRVPISQVVTNVEGAWRIDKGCHTDG